MCTEMADDSFAIVSGVRERKAPGDPIAQMDSDGPEPATRIASYISDLGEINDASDELAWQEALPQKDHALIRDDE
jgi:hypothetical protein